MMLAARDVQLVQETVEELHLRGQSEQARALKTILDIAMSSLADQQGQPRELLTTSQAADVLGVSRQTIASWVAAGSLPGLRVGGRIVIHREAVLAQLESLRVSRPEQAQQASDSSISEHDWQQLLTVGLAADKIDRLEALHQKLEDGERLTRSERTEMTALEQQIVDAAGQSLENWLRQPRSST